MHARGLLSSTLLFSYNKDEIDPMFLSKIETFKCSVEYRRMSHFPINRETNKDMLSRQIYVGLFFERKL